MKWCARSLFVFAMPFALFAQQAAGGQAGGMMGSIFPMMIVMFLIVYFLMIRPEQKKQKLRTKLMSEMKKGDKVLTAGGIYGTIAQVKGETISLKIADNTTIEVTKVAISNVIAKEGAEKPSEKEEPKEKK
jgi:preprotein translocase subunit YajC